ncbi:MAG: hypothetical protein RI900_3000 [Actinomycetota bacterium]
MSIPVSPHELGATLADYPWGYLVSVGADGVAHMLALPTRWHDGVLLAEAGRGTRANVAERPEVTWAFPGVDGTAYSLIVDGRAEVAGDVVLVHPVSAVLHRPALRERG